MKPKQSDILPPPADLAFSRLWQLHAPWFGNDPIIKGIVRAVFDEGVQVGIRRVGELTAQIIEPKHEERGGDCMCQLCEGYQKGLEVA